MRFRLFGIPVEVQPGFWLIAAALGFDYLSQPPRVLFPIWVAVVFVSIMVHELGHAIAVIRYRGDPSITLHMLGGLTSWRASMRLRRIDRIIISFAGPLAGFILAGAIYAFIRLAPGVASDLNQYLAFGLERLFMVNLAWGIFNLIPVLPFDGGHILEAALGPQRTRIAALVSLICGVSIALMFLFARQIWGTLIVGLGALQSYQRFQAESRNRASKRPPAPPAWNRKSEKPDRPVPPEMNAQLATAKAALADDLYEQAGSIAETIIALDPPERARIDALHILGWAHLLAERPDQAARVVAAIERHGKVDVALVGAVLYAKGDLLRAREILSSARADGDNRKEVVGPLIQILINQGEIDRAAAIALDIVDSLSEEDARQMAVIAFDSEAYEWSSRLSEAVFERSGLPDDAYDAARSRALEGDESGAVALLRRAVAAGFSDAARAWSDSALEKLHTSDDLEALLPKPSKG